MADTQQSWNYNKIIVWPVLQYVYSQFNKYNIRANAQQFWNHNKIIILVLTGVVVEHSLVSVLPVTIISHKSTKYIHRLNNI